MESIIRELWNGNLQPCVGCGKENYEIIDSISLLQKNGEKLNDLLNNDQQKFFAAYNEKIELYLSLLAEQAFYDGFKMGYKFTTEALSCNF